MAFKDSFRIEKIYFQRVKDNAQILNGWKKDPRRLYSLEEIVRISKDSCDSILMLYRLLGESWNDALNQIEKLGAELEALAGKTEAYHDELNEKIDEVNNYLNNEIKNLEIRVENIENSIEDFGGLPSNENANEGDVLTVGENHVNEWKTPNGGGLDVFLIKLNDDELDTPTINGSPIRIKDNTTPYSLFEVLQKFYNGECLVRVSVNVTTRNVETPEFFPLSCGYIAQANGFAIVIPYIGGGATHKTESEINTGFAITQSVGIMANENMENVFYTTLAGDSRLLDYGFVAPFGNA